MEHIDPFLFFLILSDEVFKRKATSERFARM